jgi:hypothetical protein
MEPITKDSKRYIVDTNYNDSIIDTQSDDKYTKFFWLEGLVKIADHMNKQEEEIKRLKNTIAEF